MRTFSCNRPLFLTIKGLVFVDEIVFTVFHWQRAVQRIPLKVKFWIRLFQKLGTSDLKILFCRENEVFRLLVSQRCPSLGSCPEAGLW
jgi:hypothetical protein